MSIVFPKGKAEIEANLTPMIDVTFLLIVFFVLVSQIVDLESVEMELPRPADPATELATDENRSVLNVLPGQEGLSNGYIFGNRLYATDTAGITSLTAAIARVYETNPAIYLNLRADRSTDYRWVEPVLRAVSGAARAAGTTPRINLVVVREEDP